MGNETAVPSPQDLDAILLAAGLAPSPDNNQPWAFAAEGGLVGVLHVRDKAVRSDVRDLFSWLAIGAAVENLALAAGARGFAAAVDWHLPPTRAAEGEHVATVTLSEGGEPDPLAERIETRHTNRRPFVTEAPDPEALARIAGTVRDEANGVLFVTERPRIEEVADLVAVADRVRFESRRFHEELHGMIRHSEEEVEELRDGLDIRTLEIPQKLWKSVRFLRPWGRMRIANLLGASRSFAKMSAKQVLATGVLGLLVTGNDTGEGYLEAGRDLERVWLAAEAEGLAFHCLGSVPLFLLKLEADRDAFKEKHARRLDGVAERLEDTLPEIADRRAVMLFRLGRAEGPPSARSVRYSPEVVRIAAARADSEGRETT